MRWNWQLPDWPDFRFDAERIRASEEQFLKGSGVVIGALHHLDTDERDGLTIELISQEVIDSSAIEGEILDRASVQSSLARHLGFAADQRRASAAEAGAAELMADVYRSHAAPLDDRTLFAWHAMLMNGRRDIADVGRYARAGQTDLRCQFSHGHTSVSVQSGDDGSIGGVERPCDIAASVHWHAIRSGSSVCPGNIVTRRLPIDTEH